MSVGGGGVVYIDVLETILGIAIGINFWEILFYTFILRKNENQFWF